MTGTGVGVGDAGPHVGRHCLKHARLVHPQQQGRGSIVGVLVTVGVGVSVGVLVMLLVGVIVGVSVEVGVGVTVGVLVSVPFGVGVVVGVPQTIWAAETAA